MQAFGANSLLKKSLCNEHHTLFSRQSLSLWLKNTEPLVECQHLAFLFLKHYHRTKLIFQVKKAVVKIKRKNANIFLVQHASLQLNCVGAETS